MKRIISQVHSRTDSSGHTEIMETTLVRKVQPEPDFVKMYVDDIARLRGLTQKEREVLDEILSRMDYQNEVHLATGTRIEMCVNCGIMQKASRTTGEIKENEPSLNSFGVILNRLTKAEVIFKKGKGVYMVNPTLFGKGRWSDIEKIRLTILYQPGARQELPAIQRAGERIVMEDRSTRKSKADTGVSDAEENASPWKQLPLELPDAGESGAL